VHKNEDRPIGAHRNEEIETLFRRVSLAIGLVSDDLAFRKVCLFVQKLNSGPLDGRTSRKKGDTETRTDDGETGSGSPDNTRGRHRYKLAESGKNKCAPFNESDLESVDLELVPHQQLSNQASQSLVHQTDICLE
jgi:hypothetical protein